MQRSEARENVSKWCARDWDRSWVGNMAGCGEMVVKINVLYRKVECVYFMQIYDTRLGGKYNDLRVAYTKCIR